MTKAVWIALALMAGAMLPIQGGLNAKLAKSIHSPLYASMISFVTGALVLIICVVFWRQPLNSAGFKDAPYYVWIAGALGAVYVTAVILAFPRIGPTLTFGLVVAGQMIVAVVLDHFNVLTAAQHPVNIWRVLGIALILTGVVIVRKF
jgi:transporter family-2 protein